MKHNFCKDEKIKIPGKLQTFGYLIGIDEDFTIKFYSKNIEILFNIETSFLDKSLEIFPVLFNWLKDRLTKSMDHYHDIKIISLHGTSYYLKYIFYKKHYYIELESISIDVRTSVLQYPASNKYDQIKNIDKLWPVLLDDLFALTGYDRVMVYQFLENGTGKVICEKKNDDLESYLGLHYPADDIPEQARELYMQHKRRIFSDVEKLPVEIVSLLNEDVDLTYCDARAMSPMHREYLVNAGVQSSFSVSIIVDDQLWGLITCQNIRSKHIDLHHRNLAELLTNYASKTYALIYYKDINKFAGMIDSQIGELKSKLLNYDYFIEGIKDNYEFLLELSNSNGVAYVTSDALITHGIVPKKDEILGIINWYRTKNFKVNDIYINELFAKSYPHLIDDVGNVSGIVINEINRDNFKYFIWFRKEYCEYINWAGNPLNILEHQFVGSENHTVSPRKSFELYLEEIKGQSKPWSKKEQIVIKKLQNMLYEVSFSFLGKTQRHNAHLKEINEELDRFASTISHDLGTPLTVIKLNLQRLNQKLKSSTLYTEGLTEIYSQVEEMEKMMKNILAISKTTKIEANYTSIDMFKLIDQIVSQNKLIYNPTTLIEYGSLPNLYSEPTLIHQLFQNIISNAIKYSSQRDFPKIFIDGNTEEDYVIYSIADNGIGIHAQDVDLIFKRFNRLDNAQSFQGNGVGLSIVAKILNRLHGKCEVINNGYGGTTFTLYLKNELQSL